MWCSLDGSEIPSLGTKGKILLPVRCLCCRIYIWLQKPPGICILSFYIYHMVTPAPLPLTLPPQRVSILLTLPTTIVQSRPGAWHDLRRDLYFVMTEAVASY